MSTHIKYTTFTFENCDRITIDGRYIGNFLVDDIRSYISRVACNAIEKVDVANTFIIEIHRNANVERQQFGLKDFNQMTFDRLTLGDITSIEFVLENSYQVEDEELPMEHYDYYVDWISDNNCCNEAQHNYISNEGHLYIVISKDKSIEDFFDLAEVNNKELMDFEWEMYGLYEGTV